MTKSERWRTEYYKLHGFLAELIEVDAEAKEKIINVFKVWEILLHFESVGLPLRLPKS